MVVERALTTFVYTCMRVDRKEAEKKQQEAAAAGGAAKEDKMQE